MELVFREATVADARGLLDHIHTVSKETDHLSFGAEDFNISAEREARFIDRFSKSEKDLMLVALDGELVVGNGIIEREKIKRFNHIAELSITVLRDYWGQGIGSRLMELMLDFCKKSGVGSVRLYARADNVAAVSLYKKFGFETVGIYKEYFHIGEKYFDGIFMQKLLTEHCDNNC